MNQLIVRIMNHKKNRLKSNSKILKNESNSDSKSDAKNNLNSNSNFNFKKLKSDKEKKRHTCHLILTKSAATVIKEIMKSHIAN